MAATTGQFRSTGCPTRQEGVTHLGRGRVIAVGTAEMAGGGRISKPGQCCPSPVRSARQVHQQPLPQLHCWVRHTGGVGGVIEIPGSLRWVAYLAGSEWSAGDETAIFELRGDWYGGAA